VVGGERGAGALRAGVLNLQTASALIEVSGLTKFYGQRAAVQDLTFEVPKGQVLGFLGPNGAGKSTTMRILTGYIGATSGRAKVAGFDVFEDSIEVRRRVGYLPETAPLYNEMRVRGFLELMCSLRGVPRARRRARVDHAIEACGLEARRNEVIGRLSRGLRQRVGLAQSIVHQPDVLILDEPTAGLDPAQTRETRDLIRDLGRRHTVILSSHILSEVSATCQRVLIINEGKLVGDGSPSQLAERLARGRGQEVEMTLTLAGEAAAVEAGLHRVGGVDSVAVSGLGDDLWRVVVTGSGSHLREDLTRAAVEAGAGVREVQAKRVSLEDVFLSLTADDEAGEGEKA